LDLSFVSSRVVFAGVAEDVLTSSERTDFVVVGGGPAGLAVAIYARLAGRSVVVMDAGTPPIDKACGEGIMPSGVASLREMGVVVPEQGCSPFIGIRYLDPQARLPLAEAEFPHGQGLGVRRLFLHQALIDRAHALGADLRWNTTVTGLTQGGVMLEGGEVLGNVIVGADGLHSRVRRWAGLERDVTGAVRFGVRRHYTIAPWSPFVEVTWADNAEAYLTPVGPERVGLGFIWTGGPARYDALLRRFPGLHERLADAPFESTARGAGPFLQGTRGVVSGSVALVGDASGYVDAISGEGIAIAFHEASSLVRCAVAGRMNTYGREHRRITRGYRLTVALLLSIVSRPRLRRRVLFALSREPEVFRYMLGLNDGVFRPPLALLPALPRYLFRFLVGRA